MSCEIDLALHAYEKRFIGGRHVVPRIRAGTRDVEILDTATTRNLARERLSHGTSAGIAAADEKKIHFLGVA
jgi:hypothetical protein